MSRQLCKTSLPLVLQTLPVYFVLADNVWNSIHVHIIVLFSQGSLGHTLKEVQPTMFFGVPRSAQIVHTYNTLFTSVFKPHWGVDWVKEILIYSSSNVPMGNVSFIPHQHGTPLCFMAYALCERRIVRLTGLAAMVKYGRVVLL